MLITVIRRNWQPIPKVLFALVVCLTAMGTVDRPPQPELWVGAFANNTSMQDRDGDCAASNAFPGACYSISGTTAACYQRCAANWNGHKSDNASQGRLACYRKS